MRPLWFVLGWAAVGAGLAGIPLPLVPTTPFLLLAAFAFAKGSPRARAWLLGHPRLGPPIEAWRRHGVIAPRAKAAAMAALAVSLAPGVALSLGGGVPGWAIAAQGAVIAAVAAFLLSRPGRPR